MVVMVLNQSHTDYRTLFTPETDELLHVSYVIVATLGILFNGVLFSLILWHRQLRTIVNLLILNLAIANIIACFNVFPFIYLDIDKTSIRGHTADLLCGISEGLSIFFIGASVSIQVLGVLSFSRYLIIHHPVCFPWRLDKQNLKYIVCLLWISSIALVVPNFISFHYEEDKKFCFKEWAHGVKPLAYLSVVAIFNVIIPLSSLTFTYCTTLRTLCRKQNTNSVVSRSNRVPVTRSKDISHFRSSYRTAGSRHSNTLGETSNRVKKHVVILLGMLIGVYLICWIPFTVYWLLSAGTNFFGGSGDDAQMNAVRICRAVTLAALCSTVLNPLAYACANSHLRAAFREVFRGNKVSMYLSQRSAPVTVFQLERHGTFNREERIKVSAQIEGDASAYVIGN